ncbi:hypothetical protein ILUMI_18038 [Ignelater luminosus]|uniref:RNase H type-1 domain-containing protein n=1 Tax=Ignelater luminosus TaxID=2038154 RepID=A0A8K0G1A6_IGNLU|nr:hypothetical protein ILUMI_18038 [Ignelater luminosus]
MIAGKHALELEAIRNEVLMKIEFWSKGNKILFNTKKSVALHLTRRRTNHAIKVYIIIKGCRTISYEAACVIANIISICLKARALTLDDINIKRYGAPINLKFWLHPAEIPSIKENDNSNTEYKGQIYTDGSKDESNVRCAVVSYINGEIIYENKFKLNNRCSNNQAELLAIFKALEWILSKEEHECESCSWWVKWVKAHSGLEGSKKADRLATEASKDEKLAESYKHFPRSILKTYVYIAHKMASVHVKFAVQLASGEFGFPTYDIRFWNWDLGFWSSKSGYLRYVRYKILDFRN